MRHSFDLVLCDGPPSKTRGGRYGLIPIMHSRMRRSAKVFVDDTGRTDEVAIIQRWKHLVGDQLETTGSFPTFTLLSLE
jgi:hypothetical protein